MRSLLILLTLSLFSQLHVHGEDRDTVQQQLKKRYGTATPWGNGYIVSANGYFGFSDRKGKLVLPFGFRCIDTLLPDRARLCNDEHHRGSVLINADGIPVNQGSNHYLRLVNKTGRIFAMDIGNNMELLANDSGRQMTYQGHSKDAPPQTAVPTMKFTGESYLYGIVSIAGDTLLPMTYSRVSVGRQLYAGTRNDTAFVFSRTKGLLFKIAAVHECLVLQNDFIVVKKFGMSALVSRQGKLLSDFIYSEISDFRYPYSIMPRSANGNTPQPPAIPQYAEIKIGQPKGLIDANGRVVLPVIYDNISMNLNGWFVLRKTMLGKEILTDATFHKIITADAYDLSFVNERYVTNTTTDRESDASLTRIYDMKLRKYVPKMTNNFKKFPGGKTTTSPSYSSNDIHVISERTHPDSMAINYALTCLRKKNGRWGVQSITGDTILPFVYDTAGFYFYHQFFVGQGNKYSILDAEGKLLVPLLLPKVPWFITPDSLAMTTNKEVYSLKGGVLTNVDINDNMVRRHLLKPDKPGLIRFDNSSYGLKTGIYNSRLQLLSERPYIDRNRRWVMNTGMAVVIDATGANVALMDTNGSMASKWIPKPQDVKMYNSCVLAMYDTGRADILFRIENDRIMCDTVFVDNNEKKLLLYRSAPRNYEYQNTTEYGIQFIMPQVGRGILLNGSGACLLVPGTDKIVASRNYTILNVRGKWSLHDGKGTALLPAVYDSIAFCADYNFFLFKEKKVGVYDGATKKTIEPSFDTIYYTGSLRNRFLIGHKGGTAEFVNENGMVFSKSWKQVPALMYSVIGGIPANRNGRKYQLFPSLGDSLAAVPDEIVPEGVAIVRSFMDGTAIVTGSSRYGVYDVVKKKWLLPLIFGEIEEQSDHFIATNATEPPKVSIYNTEGRQLFSLKGGYYPQREHSFGQWYMHGWYGTPVVNNIGKKIIADTFDKAFVITGAQRHLYQAITTSEKRAIIDSSGKIMTKAILDYVSGDTWMYNGYFIGSIDGSVCLLSPAGKMLTPCAYKEIFPGQRLPETENRRDMISILQPESDEVFRPVFIAVDSGSGKFGVIDSTGRTLIPCVYDSIRQVHHQKIAVVKKNEKWGLVTLQNKPVTEIKYDMLGIFLNGTTSFKKADAVGVINEDGREVPE